MASDVELCDAASTASSLLFLVFSLILLVQFFPQRIWSRKVQEKIAIFFFLYIVAA